MRILFLTSRLPFPPIGGDKIRTYNFLKYLKTKHEICLISFIESKYELQFISAYKYCYDKIITLKLPKFQSYKNCLKGLISYLPLQVHYYYSKRMSKIVENELSKGYDVIFCHLIRMAQYLTEDNKIYKIVDLTDAISLNYFRSQKFRKSIFFLINSLETKRVFDYEINIINKSDLSLLISEIDANFLSKQANKNKIKIVSNGVDLQQFNFYTGSYDKNKIVFVGNMRTFPNTDAVIFFIKKILPIIKKIKPNLRFYVIGNQPTKKVRKFHNGKDIFVSGYVDSIIPYIQDAVVMVAPMRTGSGIQNKILEAFALGIPVVTTPIGAEGLDGSVLNIGNTPEEFAYLVLNLIDNSEIRKTQSIICRKYIEKNFSWQDSLSKLDLYLNNGKFILRNESYHQGKYKQWKS